VDPRLLSYIQQYRYTYTREAINQQLVQIGFSQEQLDQAWQAVEASTPDPTYAQPGQFPVNPFVAPDYIPAVLPRRNNGSFWGTLISYTVLTPIVLVFLSSIIVSVTRLSSLGWVAFFIPIAGGIWGAIYYRERDRAVSRGLLYGMLTLYIILPFASVVIIGGICLTISHP
jgi:hypothetical protein